MLVAFYLQWGELCVLRIQEKDAHHIDNAARHAYESFLCDFDEDSGFFYYDTFAEALKHWLRGIEIRYEDLTHEYEYDEAKHIIRRKHTERKIKDDHVYWW